MFDLKDIVPWGRSFKEYVDMFALSDDDLRKRLLGCGDGPASFNAMLSARGGRVVSCDPLYGLSAGRIRDRIRVTFAEVMEQTGRNRDEFLWERIGSVEELGRVRIEAMEEFLSDYEAGLREGRYVEAALPSLPFKDDEFDIALCSHLLFLYSEKLSMGFHMDSIRELLRVAKQVRIFPLLELGGKKSRHLEGVVEALRNGGLVADILRVPYEFQKGGNQMLRVTAGQGK